MGENSLPRVNEAVAFLDKFAPEDIASLRRKGEVYAQALEAGIIGGEDDTLAPDVERASLVARAEVLDVALTEAIEKCGPAATELLTKLKLARRVQFAAAALAAIASSGVIASAFIDRVTTIVAGSIALVSSLTGMFADMVVLRGSGGYDRLRETARTLIKDEGMARVAQANVAAALKANVPGPALADLVREGNALFAEINQALADART